jgi:hypothetical protein
MLPLIPSQIITKLNLWAINNPRTTEDGRDGAEAQLRSMGVKPNKSVILSLTYTFRYRSSWLIGRPTLTTRIRHFFGLPGKSHRRNAHTRTI